MMPVEILKEGADYAAWDEEILEIGYGASPAEARANLVLATRDTHRELSMLGPDRLGPDLRRVLEVLNGRTMMAEEKDRIERAADTVEKLAKDVDESLARDGYKDYQDKPADRDWRKGYSSACRDAAKALRE